MTYNLPLAAAWLLPSKSPDIAKHSNVPRLTDMAALQLAVWSAGSTAQCNSI